jgi:hypothetical protein
VIHHALGLLGSPERLRRESPNRAAAEPGRTSAGEVEGALEGKVESKAEGRIESGMEGRIEAAVIEAFAALNLDPGSWDIRQDFVRPLVKVLQLAEFRAWFEPGAASLSEAEILDAAGAVYRPDRVVIGAGRVEAIDFKVGRREDAHREQVRTYIGLLAEVFAGMPVAGYLVYIDEPAIVEVK